MLRESPEITLSGRPDRVLMLADVDAHKAQQIAYTAVTIARLHAPKLTGASSSRLEPVYGDGYFGVFFPDPYVWFQDHGISPFTMRSLAGKAQPLTEPVLTPAGWAKMGDIRPGGYVIGSDGRGAKVLAIFPQGERECYRVTFSDGESVRCSKDHLWGVYREGNSAAYSRRMQVRTTEELMRPRSPRVWSVPTVSPVDGLTVNLGIDPYLLGVMLSEGCRGTSPTFAQKQRPVVDEVRRVLPDEMILTGCNEGRKWTITAGAQGTRHNPVAQALRDLGVWNAYSYEKFIPPPLFGASVAQRLALLQGLMDGDGSCPMQGSMRYHTASVRLADDVAELVRSLGGVARVRSESSPREGANHAMHTVRFVLPSGMEPFRADLEKKLVRFRATERRAATRKQIVSIEPDGVEEMQCILIDSSDHLYVTSGYTLTHNTIPMWINDPTGAERSKNPKAKTRTTASGVVQVLIFRKAARLGSQITKRKRDPKTGRVVETSKPASYPGAPGRINRREMGAPHTTPGRLGGAIAPGNGGVRWRHPGIAPRLFLNHGVTMAAQQHGILPVRVYVCDSTTNLQRYQ